MHIVGLVFTTCIFCRAPLGSNLEIEVFPVGRRLAFDEARGRLWVVCRSCERWNLSPLEERWEAIEECERRFRGTRLRLSTDNIGLARLSSGLELVRIGTPLRPELAAWRYGDQFGRRRRRRLLIAGSGIGVLAAAAAGGFAMGLEVTALSSLYNTMPFMVRGWPRTVIARLPLADGQYVNVQRLHLSTLAIRGGASANDWALCLRPYKRGVPGALELTGEHARRAAALLLPAVNRYGATAAEVRAALGLLDASPEPLGAFALTARAQDHALVAKLPTSVRIALEMASHEDLERRALAGELAELERAWREAEEVAAIADNLLVPEPVERTVARLRASAGTPAQ